MLNTEQDGQTRRPSPGARTAPPAAAPRRDPALRRRLLGFALAVGLPLLVLAAGAVWRQDRADRDRAGDAMVAQAHAMSLLLDREFQTAEQVLRSLAGSNALATGDLAAFRREMLAAATASAARSIVLVGPDRTVRLTTRRPVDDGPPVRVNGPAGEALLSGQAVVGNLFTSAMVGDLTISVAIPLDNPGLPGRHALSLVIPQDRLLAAMAAQRLPPGAIASVLDRDHRLVARTRPLPGAPGQRVPAERIDGMRDEAGLLPFVTPSLEGDPVVLAYARAPHSGYWTTVSLPAAAFEAPLRAALWPTLLAGAAVLGASLLLGAAMARRIAGIPRDLPTPGGVAPAPALPLPEAAALPDAPARIAAAHGATLAGLLALFDASPVGVVQADAGGRVLDANDAFLRIVGMTRVDLAAGRVRWDDLTPPEWIGRDEAAIAEAARSGGCAPYQKEYTRPDGSRVPVLSFFAFTDAAHGLAAGFCVDLSGWRVTEAALMHTLGQLRLAIGAARMFFWDWNLVTDTVEWSDGLEAACGLPPGGFGGTAAAFRALVHPDDLARVSAALSAALAGDAAYDIEFRMRRADGTHRWVAARGTVLRDGAGQAVRMVGIDRDITDRKTTEAALREKDSRFLSLAEGSDDVIYVLDLDGGQLEYLGPAFERIWGEPRDAILRDLGRWTALLHPDDRAAAEATARRVQQDGERVSGEYRIIRPDGTIRHIRDTAVPIRDSTGRPIKVAGIAHDVTELYAARESLAEREAQLRLFVDRAPAAIAMFDTGFRYLAASRRYVQDLRLGGEAGPEGLIGRCHYDLRPEMPRYWFDIHRRVLAGETLSAADTLYAQGGEVDSIRWEITPWRRPDGSVGGAMLFVEVETARRKAEAALAASEAQLRRALGELEAIYRAAPVGLAVVDGEFRFRNVNPALAAINGLPAEAHLGRTVAEVLPELWPALEPTYRAVLERGERFVEIPVMGRTPAATEDRHYLASYYPVQDGAGAVWAVGVVVHDVTDRHRAAAALAAREADFRTLAEALPAFVFVTDVEGSNTYVNRRFQDYTGLPAAALMEFGWLQIFHPEDRVRAASLWAEAVATGAPYEAEYRFRRHDGTYRWFLVRGEPQRGADGRITRWTGTCTDIDDLRSAERSLAGAQDRLQLAMEAAELGTWSWDLRDGEMAMSPRGRALYGIDPAAAVDYDLLIAAIHPDDRATTERQILDSVAARGDYDIEHRILLPDGTTPWRRSRGRAGFGPDGSAILLRGVVMDIDAQKAAEAALRADRDLLEERVAERTAALSMAAAELTAEMRRREEAQAALLQAQKLEALGQLTGGVAHDFNNVLAAVMGSLRLIARRAEPGSAIADFASNGEKAAQRAVALIRQLLAFARREDSAPTVVEPAALIRGSRELVQQAMGMGIRLEVEVGPDIWPVRTDPHRLEVALLNLALNARDAMGGVGQVALSVRNVPRNRGDDAAADRPAAAHPDADHVVITLRDSGPGMPPEVLARAEEPFFTTKPPGKGTGLGLAMVRNFVEQSGGGMRLRSAPGQGTAVALWLPRAAASAPERAEPGASDPALHGGATVLVVDDLDTVRVVTATALRDLGYTVIEASGPEAALVQALAAEQLDLMVTDVTMPGMDGPALAARIRAQRPGLPVVFVSGLAGRQDLVAHEVLSKPFTPAELGDRVLAALGRLPPPDRLLPRLRREELREAYLAWRRLRDVAGGAGCLPTLAALEPASLLGAPHACVIELDWSAAVAPGFRCRQIGAALVALLGLPEPAAMQALEATSTDPSDHASVLSGLGGIYARCARLAVPCYDYTRDGYNADESPLLLERLLLPLAADGGAKPTHLLGFALYGPLT